MVYKSQYSGISWNCVRFLSKSHDISAIYELRDEEYRVFDMDCSFLKTREDLFNAIADCMKFPNYFGKNWDALDECLCDLDWVKAKGYVLILSNAKTFFCNLTLAAGQLIEIWQNCAEIWAKENIPFYLVFIV